MLNAAAATESTTETSVEAAPAETPAKLPIKIVTHFYPDPDALASIWAAIRFLANAQGRECHPIFVKAGEGLPAEDYDGFEVITVDTGRGALDQHGKNLGEMSSFRLFCAQYGLLEDPGMKPIIELTVLSDNVRHSKIPATSIHFVLKGLPYYFKDPKSKEVDWSAVVNEACKLFDIIYDQACMQAKAVKDFQTFGRVVTLKNGIKLGAIWHRPHLRQAAFDSGCDVVMWTQDLKGERKGKFYPAIQAHEETDPHLKFESVIAGIRFAEAAKRGTDTKGVDMRAWGQHKELFGGWFMHDSCRFAACGTRAHELELAECTLLTEREILDIVKARLEKEPFLRRR